MIATTKNDRGVKKLYTTFCSRTFRISLHIFFGQRGIWFYETRMIWPILDGEASPFLWITVSFYTKTCSPSPLPSDWPAPPWRWLAVLAQYSMCIYNMYTVQCVLAKCGGSLLQKSPLECITLQTNDKNTYRCISQCNITMFMIILQFPPHDEIMREKSIWFRFFSSKWRGGGV